MKLKLHRTAMQITRAGLLGAVLVAGSTALPSFAAVGVNDDIGVPVAPPPPREEVIPTAPAGYVWSPGFWGYVNGQYVWRRGHLIQGRPGYRWAPEHWEERGGAHHFNEGHWERDPHR